MVYEGTACDTTVEMSEESETENSQDAKSKGVNSDFNEESGGDAESSQDED